MTTTTGKTGNGRPPPEELVLRSRDGGVHILTLNDANPQ